MTTVLKDLCQAIASHEIVHKPYLSYAKRVFHLHNLNYVELWKYFNVV
jgi:hypothetical protein